MKKVATIRGYDLYKKGDLYNAVPKGMKPPDIGYDLDEIARQKGINPLAWSIPLDKLTHITYDNGTKSD